MADLMLITEDEYREFVRLLYEANRRYAAALDLLKQAEIVIRPEPGKIVYRTARVAWAEQFDQLIKEFDHGNT